MDWVDTLLNLENTSEEDFQVRAKKPFLRYRLRMDWEKELELTPEYDEANNLRTLTITINGNLLRGEREIKFVYALFWQQAVSKHPDIVNLDELRLHYVRTLLDRSAQAYHRDHGQFVSDLYEHLVEK
jgi:hypothetical protein